MTDERPPVVASLAWDGDERFTAQVGGHGLVVDGRSEAAPTPVHLLAVSIAGCMAIDLVHILTRGRHPVTSLVTTFSGRRSPEEPRRLTHVRLEFRLTGQVLPEHVERAIRLSRDKYCSVWNTVRPDVELETSFTIG